MNHSPSRFPLLYAAFSCLSLFGVAETWLTFNNIRRGGNHIEDGAKTLVWT